MIEVLRRPLESAEHAGLGDGERGDAHRAEGQPQRIGLPGQADAGQQQAGPEAGGQRRQGDVTGAAQPPVRPAVPTVMSADPRAPVGPVHPGGMSRTARAFHPAFP